MRAAIKPFTVNLKPVQSAMHDWEHVCPPILNVASSLAGSLTTAIRVLPERAAGLLRPPERRVLVLGLGREAGDALYVAPGDRVKIW